MRSYPDGPPPLPQRAIGGFEHLDDPGTGDAVIERRQPLCDTLDEIAELGFERLGLLDAWSPHVARAIAHKQLIEALAVAHLDALVVDLDLFVRLQIVPDQHLLLPPDQGRPDFDRGQPVDIDVRNHVTGEIDGDEGDVHETVQVRFAGRNYGFGLRLDEKIHDGQIMRGEVPEDADVVLEEPQVDPRGIVV